LFNEDPAMKTLDRSTLQLALIGCGAELKKIVAPIASIRKQVDEHAADAVDGAPDQGATCQPQPGAESAQRQCWTVFHAKKKGGSAKTAPRRKLSAAARAKLAANCATARAAKAAKAKRMAKAA
jgi:hypothetical protein